MDRADLPLVRRRGRYTDPLTRGEELNRLASRPDLAQREDGYFDTLREILQQPDTWLETERLVRSSAVPVPNDVRAIVLTGSGSSEYAGACVASSLQRALGIPLSAIGSGAILVDPSGSVPPVRPCLLVSLARSGNSPESCAVVERLRESDPGIRHLAITCNPEGRLAKMSGLSVLLLPERTNDRSFVMTSSVTNLALAARLLGRLDEAATLSWAEAARTVFRLYSDEIARVARSGFTRAVFLGSGGLYGAAREGALKMLEMTAGRVATMAETWLGLRHGPMAMIDDETLIVGFVASSEPARSFELDVLTDISRKNLGAAKLIVGGERAQPGETNIAVPQAALVSIVVAQLLAFFRCLAGGLKPDAPSPTGVITRVVENFPIHRGGRVS